VDVFINMMRTYIYCDWGQSWHHNVHSVASARVQGNLAMCTSRRCMDEWSYTSVHSQYRHYMEVCRQLHV